MNDEVISYRVTFGLTPQMGDRLERAIKRSGKDAGSYVVELIEKDLADRIDLDRPGFRVNQVVRVKIGEAEYYGQIKALGTRAVQVRLTESSHERMADHSPGHPIECWWSERCIEAV